MKIRWFSLISLLLGLIIAFSSYGRAQAGNVDSPSYFPNSFHVEATCEGATAVSDVAIGTTYTDSDGKIWTLHEVIVTGGSYDSDGHTSGQITFHWGDHFHPLGHLHIHESSNWSADRPDDCTTPLPGVTPIVTYVPKWVPTCEQMAKMDPETFKSWLNRWAVVDCTNRGFHTGAGVGNGFTAILFIMGALLALFGVGSMLFGKKQA